MKEIPINVLIEIKSKKGRHGPKIFIQATVVQPNRCTAYEVPAGSS